MKNNITELVFIIDKSGSMAGFEDDTIGGFNSMIEEQKKLDGKVFVSTVLFSNFSSVLHDRVPIENVEPMTKDTYRVGGCTALIDAIGGAVHHIENIHKYARPEDVPSKTVFVITTDGMENASNEYNSAQVKQMIKDNEEQHGWEFLFLAANIDAVESAVSIGIRPTRAAEYRQTSEGTKNLYKAMNSAIRSMRVCEDVGDEWREILSEDEEAKKNRRFKK